MTVKHIIAPTAILATAFMFCILTTPNFVVQILRQPLTSSLSPFPSMISNDFVLPSVRTGSNLIYWKPHKTGSTSMRTWLLNISTVLQIPLQTSKYYPNSKIQHHHDRLGKNCSIFAGHVRVPDISKRRDERELGSVVTTTRNSFNTLASKYFHRTSRTLNESELQEYKKRSSSLSRLWFFYFNDNDACEVLRYYDGLERCEDGNDLLKRVDNIAKRIDCVVDTDDPVPDLKILCRVIGVDNIDCPEYPNRRARARRDLYKDLYDIKHIRDVVQRSLRVTELLRIAFLKRRCRFLVTGNGLGHGVLKQDVGAGAKPRWPVRGCVSQSP